MSFPTRSGRSFEELPPEILLLIQENLITPSYIFSLIRASPVAYRAFRHKKVVVLANAIRRSIHPAILPLAITVCDAASDFSSSKCSMAWETAKRECHNPDYAYINSCLHRFYKYIYRTTTATGDEIRLNKVADTRYNIDFRLQDLSLVLSLCRLWSTTEFFIRDYPTGNFQKYYPNEAITRGPESASSLSGNADLGLSKSEYGRLQRGFFHFELYRHLFGGLNRHRWLRVSRGTNSLHNDMFMSCLTEAEQGELESVQQHLESCLNAELDSIYSSLVSKIEDLPWRMYRLKPNIFFTKNRLRRDAWRQFKEVETVLTELGLPFIQTFKKMEYKERLAVVKLLAAQQYEPRMLSGLSSYTPYERTTARCAKYCFIHQVQQHQQKKLMFDLTQDGRSKECNWLLQAIRFDLLHKAFGFFFWDDARRCDLRTILIQFGGTDSPCTREQLAKRLAKMRAGLADARYLAPDIVLEMKDFLKIKKSLEY